MKPALLFFCILVTNIYAQFDSLIFTKSINLNYEGTSIYQLGDQNSDGFDDIMLYDCNDKRGYIYFGGSPIDTIAVNSIQFYDSIYTPGPTRVPSIAIIDINYDDINDIIVSTMVYDDTIFWHPGPIRIYYGGNNIDTIPNISFYPPPGGKYVLLQVLKDFNGDGRSELVMYDAFLPNTQKDFGTLYFYNTESQFDTIPHYVMMGDSVNKIKIGVSFDSGDLNGDGKSDFTFLGSEGEGSSYRPFRSFYLGNENFDLEPAVIFYRDEHSFDQSMKIINDINGDGKDDILIYDYGFYPYYYRNAILHGSFPIDTIPDVGLNSQNIPLSAYETFSLGDVNGDNFNDFFCKDAGFYPNVKLWVGGRNMPYTSDDQANKTWFGTSGGFGRVISAVGDVDGDGVNDVAICEIPYGVPTDCKMSLVYIFNGDTSVIGDTGTVGVINEEDVIEGFYLYEPYPNPFNPETVISYQLSVISKIKITVYDIIGNKIAELINEEKPAGKYQIEFDANKYKLSSGVYFINLSILKGGNRIFSDTRKITLLK